MRILSAALATPHTSTASRKKDSAPMPRLLVKTVDITTLVKLLDEFRLGKVLGIGRFCGRHSVRQAAQNRAESVQAGIGFRLGEAGQQLISLCQFPSILDVQTG